MKHFFIGLVSFILLVGCAATKKTQVPVETKNQAKIKTPAPGQYDESFDPLSLEDDDITIQRNNAAMQSQSKALQNIPSGTASASIADSLQSYKEVDGFRVQIFAGRDIQAATMTETDAREIFAKKGMHVYLIFEAPFYKVRVGDFIDRNEAENARDLAKSLGYKSAFVVRSKVRVAQE